MLILPGPASFRFTCYYYRKAYYRAFGMDPPACAVGERNAHSYRGETKLFLIQNFHRFALYVAIGFLVFLWKDFFESLSYATGHFGLGVGTLVILANCTFLSLYTFSCHSVRHLVGGSVDSYSTAPFGKLRYAIWHKVSKLNENHMLFAWMSPVRRHAHGPLHPLGRRRRDRGFALFVLTRRRERSDAARCVQKGTRTAYADRTAALALASWG